MLPKVSILIPCYNSEEFLAETLRSCINQQYPNIEVVVVDDGSTDGSLQIAKEWEIRYENIHVYMQSNGGACKARNNAFKHCSGEYIMYLDADDLITANKVSAQVSVLKDKPLDVISFCGWDKFEHSIIGIDKQIRSIYHDYQNNIGLIEDLLNLNMLQTSCWLVHRSIIEKVGGWNEQLLINQDGEFFIRVLGYTSRVIFCSSAQVYYRTNISTSITGSHRTEKKGESLLYSFILIETYLSDKQILTPRIRNGLKRSYQSVAYQYYQYNNIVAAAHRRASNISRKKIKPSDGGFIFKSLCLIFGLWNVLKFKTLTKQIIHSFHD